MAIIDHIDPIERRIYLSYETVDSSIHPIDIYKEMRELRRLNEDLRKFDVFLRGEGNIPKGGGKYTERYVICLQGTKIVPYDTTHVLTITGTIITDDGYEGIYCFDRSKLSTGVQVDINYAPPQVEVITIETGTSGLTQEESDALLGINQNVSQLLDWNGGNWEIKNNQMIFYRLDGTVLATFDLFDQDNNPSMDSVFKRLRV